MIKNIEKIVNVSEFDSIQISLASPDRIREISYGEVKKPETINYRSLRPERDGLFCEKIFGTTKEWECYCGKFKSFRYKGVVCDRCGVEVEHFKVRRQRMGHIELAAPVAHIWYYKSVPSRIGLLLGFSIKDLKSIIYFEKYVVIDSTDTELKEKQLLTEQEYLEYKKEYGVNFTAEMGALAIKMLLQKINMDKEEESLRIEMNERGNKTDVRLLKRLELIKDIKKSCNRPEWMILDVLPVIPPELRPMVQLDTGRFATSDLNDLYRRVINRNNRLKRLLALKAPDIIIRNEKRMLQESVDSLFDNSKRKKMVKGPGNRPLKSIADMLKGKQGRFRQNLLGKRVDYSGRTVIVVGPKLKLHQCGLPKKMALELFKPFVMRHLVEKEIVYNIKGAKTIIEKESPEVWGVLEEVIKGHPILLNRAPTLHRLGIQAFEPILIDGGAIQLHPLVCHAFNADFDGDQMAVHVPLSIEAQVECWFLMLSSNNILNPANGESIVTPTQDIVLGIYLLTKINNKFPFNGKIFSSFDEVKLAHSMDYIHLQEKIKVYSENDTILETTYGRIIFNNIFKEKIEFINEVISDQVLAKLILKIFYLLGHHETVNIIDEIKNVGFEYATYFSLSIGLNDIKIPVEKKDLIKSGDDKVNKITENYNNGYITEDERVNQVIDVWTRVGDLISEKMMEQLEKDQNGFNPLYIMAKSGARGSRQQIRQLAGMRGLMVKPSGDILELPIKSNFKEGLDVLEYFISTHGARKGLADTAIKTADAGYLTRRLVDIAQDVVITKYDCKTINGVNVDLSSQSSSDEEDEILLNRIQGRFVLEDVYDFETGKKIIAFMNEINIDTAKQILASGIPTVRIRSVITCELQFGICSICYGRNLANGRIVELGEAVGVIAAQSIGQPGTQLTMRTFHIGGTAAREIEDKNIIFDYPIYVKSVPININSVDQETNKKILIVIRKGDLTYYKVLATYDAKKISKILLDDESRINMDDVIGIDHDGNNVISENSGIIKILKNKIFIYHRFESRFSMKNGTRLYIKPQDYVQKGELVGEFDPYNEPIFARKSGTIKFVDIIEGSTIRIEDNKDTGIKDQIIMDTRDMNLTPKIMIVNDMGEPLSVINIPGGAYLLVHESDSVNPGTIIAKITRSQSKTKDITGGLPRISELFEARKPKDVCVLAEQEGIVHFGEKHKGKIVINIEYDHINSDQKLEKKYSKHIIPSGKSILALDLDYVKAGDKLCDGQMNPHDILRVQSIEKLQEYLISEIQSVYRLQGVYINDKHVGIIIRQMLRKLEIMEPGDTDFIVGQQVDKFLFYEKNKKIVEYGGKAATANSILQGITRASLNIDSFISAASFQETTKVLTNAAIRSSIDSLRGLKENVIIGHLIPAGTGMKDKFEALSENENFQNIQSNLEETK